MVASAGIIAEGLGETWKRSEGSEDESVKLNIISCFTYLAMAISYGDQASLSVATQIAPYVTGLIQTVHSSPNVFIFLGDTLELWCTFLYHTPAFTEDVLRLCVSGKLDAIIEIATDEEKLTYVSRILDAYFTMAGPAFASSPAADALVAAITKVYPSLSPRGIAYLLRPLVTMFLVTERLTTAGQALIEKLFADLDTFATAETPDALVAALTILARAVINRNTELLPKLCTNSVLLAGFVAVTINALDSVPSIPTKKLIALALHAVIIKAEECGLPGSNVITQDARPHIEGVIAEINAIGGINLLTDSISDNTCLVEGSAMHTAIQNLKRNDPVFITELK